jgi:hypothetical protein
MGGRGTFAVGNEVEYTYETIDFVEGVKVLHGLGNKHDLPVESHSSNAYIKLNSDGTFNMLRLYDKDHYLTTEIAYHPERKLTGNSKRVLHVHYYDRDLNRTKAAYLEKPMYEKYKKYFKGVE